MALPAGGLRLLVRPGPTDRAAWLVSQNSLSKRAQETIVRSVFGTRVKVPLLVTQARAASFQPFGMDLTALPVPPLTLPVTLYSVSPLTVHLLAVTLEAFTVVRVVVPVPFHVIVPLPVARAEPLNVPDPPVLAVSLHPETVPVPEIPPDNFVHETPAAAPATDAVNPTVNADTGRATQAIAIITRRI
jgi:hypothetical protein